MNWEKEGRGNEKSVTLMDTCNKKYLLHMRGCTYSSRLKYLLLCGSVVFTQQNPYNEEWWYDFLPTNAYVPLQDLYFQDADPKLEQVLKLKDKGEKIGKRAYEFAMRTFS